MSLELKAKTEALIASVPNVEMLPNRDFNVFLKSSKQNNDNKLPTKKKDMIEIYHKWKHRESRKFVNSGIVLTTGSVGAVNNNEEVCYEK